MRINTYSGLIALCFFTSCIDKKYDLDNIDTDNVTVCDEVVSPLGVVVSKADEIADVNSITGLNTKDNGDFYLEYANNANFTYTPNSSLRFPIQVPAILIGIASFDGMFSDNFVLSLDNSLLTAKAKVEGNGSFDGTIKLTSLGGTESQNCTNSFSLTQASQSESFNNGLSSLIETRPQSIRVDATITNISSTITSLKDFQYILNIPLIPSSRFRAKTVQVIENAFDKDLIDNIFSSGTTTIFGTVDNELPFDIEAKMYITDSDSKRLNIDIPSQNIIGKGHQNVTFSIGENYISEMKKAKNIELEFDLKGRGNGTQMNNECLNSNQKVTITLKLKTTGGIKL